MSVSFKAAYYERQETMKDPNREFDIIIIGAGHAGCEAALACARMGKTTIVFASNLNTVAFLACNPSIGGTAKGNIVKEIDALGGEMAVNADKTLIQLRMLNLGKGPAVHCPRAQVDKIRYHLEMKKTLENTKNLFLREGEIIEIFCDGEHAKGVKLSNGLEYLAPCIIVAAGVYLNSKITSGTLEKESGPSGFAPVKQLTRSLDKLGFATRRFKTGTPARLNSRSIDFSKLEAQTTDAGMPPLSYLNKKTRLTQKDCHLTWTTKLTHEIILQNMDKAPLYSGRMGGTGARYCPSIEDKVVRFADKERHQIFLEPEGLDTNEIYVQGVSTSMPAEIQDQIYRSIPGLENAEIMRDAYAIEYDCIDATELLSSLMSKRKKGLFFAGQINGTSGYEEAAAQGLIAGINAVRFLDGKAPFVLDRTSSYIGVLIDDLTTKGTEEPYRMMTGRAEYRLLLRQDNADTRLTELGYEVGLVTKERYRMFIKKQKEIEKVKAALDEIKRPKDFENLFKDKEENMPLTGMRLSDMLKRSNIGICDLKDYFNLFKSISARALEECETDIKYGGYIARQKEQIEQFLKMENVLLPADTDYSAIGGLRLEARQKLERIKPLNLGQASRVSGVSPADIAVLVVHLSMSKKSK